MDDFGARFGLVAEFLERVDNWFDTALNVCFDDQVQLLDSARADACKDGFDRQLGFAIALAGALGSFDHRTRGALVGDDAEAIARGRHAAQAENLNRKRGRRFLDTLTAVVEQGLEAALDGAGDDQVANAQRAALDEQRSYGTTCLVHLGLDDSAAGRSVRVGLRFDFGFGDELNRLEEGIQTLFGAG